MTPEQQPPADSGLNIRDLFAEAGRQLRSDFEEIKRDNPHFGERGGEAEDILRQFLNNHLPKRFAAGSGIVIDERNQISRQSDVVVYDALNSPIYRRGSRVLILPSDNVACVVEVKSRLNKRQLEDAAVKIASVKRLYKTPVSNVDQPVISHPLVMTRTLGVVFAFESDTSLETLAENLAEINAAYGLLEWIDCVVVLDVGLIGYMLQMPFDSRFPGYFGGVTEESIPAPPWYIHLVKEDLGELSLNGFFERLMNHLMIYRARSAINPKAIIGKTDREVMTIRGYQFNLAGQLVEAEEYHRSGNFRGPTARYNIFRRVDNSFVGQVGWIPWQDGGVISYSGFLPPPLIFRFFSEAMGANPIIVPGAQDADIWLSTVVKVTSAEFETLARGINGQFVARREDEPGGSLDDVVGKPPNAT